MLVLQILFSFFPYMSHDASQFFEEKALCLSLKSWFGSKLPMSTVLLEKVTGRIVFLSVLLEKTKDTGIVQLLYSQIFFALHIFLLQHNGASKYGRLSLIYGDNKSAPQKDIDKSHYRLPILQYIFCAGDRINLQSSVSKYLDNKQPTSPVFFNNISNIDNESLLH